MKTLKFAFTLLLLVYTLNPALAQITVDTSDMFIAGNVFANGNNDSETVNLGTASANAQSWDFSTIAEDYRDTISFINPNQTPYGADFPDADMAQYDASQDLYVFFSHQNNGIFVEGINIDLSFIGYPELSVTGDPMELIFASPMTYGDAYNNTGVYERFIDQNTNDGQDTFFRRSTVKVQDVDAWGDITIPGGTNYDVIRVKENSVTVDTAIIYVAGFPLFEFEIGRDTLNTYYFVAENQRYPVFTVFANGNNDQVRLEYLAEINPTPSASFFAANIDAAVNEDIQFVNFSSGATGWEWDFGDMNTSTDIGPKHAYAAPGLYTVTLRVWNAGGADTSERIDYITVWPNAVASFSFITDDPDVTFTNTSTDATVWSWDFDDASPFSTDENPMHTYAANGSYDVRLIASNPVSADTSIQTVDMTTIGIGDNIYENLISVFPSPADQTLHVVLKGVQGGEYFLKVYNLLGQVELEQSLNLVNQVDVNGLSNGMYIYQITSASGEQLYQDRILIKH